jgi:NAD-dependent SIR2 family protein deacetylase
MKKEIVIFTGAGASAHFGLPLTADLVPLIVDGLIGGTLFKHVANGDRMRRELHGLELNEVPRFDSENSRFVSITEILTLLDYAYKRAFLDGATPRINQILNTRRLIEFAILDVIKQGYQKLDRSRVKSLESVADRFIDLSKSQGLALISTNYDELLEFQIYSAILRSERREMDVESFKICNAKINFGLSWRDGNHSKTIWHPPATSELSVFKLHGSTLWFKCNGCGWVVCDDSVVSIEQSCIDVLCQSSATISCDCGSKELGPLIVGPSLIRDTRDNGILSVWRCAEEQLRNAKKWIIIGYSLPPEDVEIVGMMLRAIRHREDRPDIVIYQIPDQDITKARYSAYFPGCDYRESGMDGFMIDLLNDRLV